MSLVETVKVTLQGAEYELTDALAEAERLADEYSEIRPIPYVVPIERYVGLPILGENKIDS
ncbi:MAG: hypothetical protein L3J30_01275 [Marinosulfonomonas sp.]|nr:hypothetical protein [Marinosulfonomonas sp.]